MIGSFLPITTCAFYDICTIITTKTNIGNAKNNTIKTNNDTDNMSNHVTFFTIISTDRKRENTY